MFSPDDRLALYRACLAANPHVSREAIERMAHTMLADERSAASDDVPTVEWYHLPGGVATCRIATRAIVVRGCLFPAEEAYSYHVAAGDESAVEGTVPTYVDARTALERALRAHLAELASGAAKKA